MKQTSIAMRRNIKGSINFLKECSAPCCDIGRLREVPQQELYHLTLELWSYHIYTYLMEDPWLDQLPGVSGQFCRLGLYFSVETQLDQISSTGVNSEQPEKSLASWWTKHAIQQSTPSVSKYKARYFYAGLLIYTN